MAEYPNGHVYIIKVENYVYVACLANQDTSRVKFFHSDEIVPASEVKSYIQSKYGHPPVWIRCMGPSNGLVQIPRSSYSLRSMAYGYTKSTEQTGIREEIDKRLGPKPSTDLRDYESVYDDDLSCRKEQKAQRKRMESRMAEYEEKASQFPSFENNYSVTDSEICEVMEWLSRNEKPTPTYNYGSCLDF